jgi:hypothetical protein
MLSRHERVGRRSVAAGIVLSISLISCTDAGGGASDAFIVETVQPQSNTPRITVGEHQAQRSGMLLTAQDMAGIDGLDDLVAVEMTDYPVFENHDPRGPCGGPALQLPVDDPVGRAFSSSSISAFELIMSRGADQVAYLDAMQADQREDCGPYESTTNRGETQAVSDITFVDLDELGAPGIGWTSRIQIGSNSADVGLLLLLADDGMVVIQMQSLAPIDVATLAAIADRSLQRANG